MENLTLTVAARTLCSNLGFLVEPGQFWCVLGSNGAGKTTLLRALAGLRPVQGGTVTLNDRALSDWKGSELARARSFLPQSEYDPFSATVLETVLTGRFPHQASMTSRWRFGLGEERVRAQEVLAELGLAGLLDRDVLSLSGGERQRVGIAALLLQDAPLMLLDEPTSHLDFDKQLLVMAVLTRSLERAGAPAAVLLSVHDINLAARFASHVLLFSGDGRVLAGPAVEVLTAPHLSAAYGHPVTELCAGTERWFSPI